MPTYEEIRPQLGTGDIVLFSGRSQVSECIKLFTSCKWSHVGMVMRLNRKLFRSDTLFLWESTTLSDLEDVIDGRAKRGVQMVLLHDRIRTYHGDVAIRRLSNAPSDATLLPLRESLRNRPYEESKLQLIRAAHDGPLSHTQQEDLSSLFCSELVAEAYQHLGLLQEPPAGLPSNEYTPRDFSSAGRIKLERGASLGPEIPVTL